MYHVMIMSSDTESVQKLEEPKGSLTHKHENKSAIFEGNLIFSLELVETNCTTSSRSPGSVQCIYNLTKLTNQPTCICIIGGVRKN